MFRFLFLILLIPTLASANSIWLDARNADFFPSDCASRVAVETFDAGETHGPESGIRKFPRMYYNGGDDSWECFLSWETPYPDGRWTGVTFHARVLYEGNDESITTCGNSCLKGGMCAVAQTSNTPQDDYCSASSEYIIDTTSASWTGKCDADSASCTDDSGCTGASNECWTDTLMTDQAGLAGTIYIGDTTWGVGQVGDDTPCTFGTCSDKKIKWIFRISAGQSVTTEDIRFLGILLYEN